MDRIGPAILIPHLQGGPYGLLWVDARPDLVKAIVAVEPSGPPFQSTVVKGSKVKLYGVTDIPLDYDPPFGPMPWSGGRPLQVQEHRTSTGQTYIIQKEPARKLPKLSRVPVLVETGEASSHALYDEVHRVRSATS